MKKFLLSLVLVLCLGLPGAAKALYTCQFGANYNQSSVSNYTTTWQVKVGENTWSIANFNNNKNGWDYVRCGRKGIASVASITTDFAIAEAINTVEVTIDKSPRADHFNQARNFSSRRFRHHRLDRRHAGR